MKGEANLLKTSMNITNSDLAMKRLALENFHYITLDIRQIHCLTKLMHHEKFALKVDRCFSQTNRSILAVCGWL